MENSIGRYVLENINYG